MIAVAILGYGTVGGGVAHVLDENAEEVRNSAGEEIRLKSILDLREFPGDPHEAQVTHDYETILNDPEIRVICETMGGENPAYEFTKKALEAGKSVCTSNKELVALHGPELVRIAREHGVSYLFEASVGGGIPILRTLAGALASEKIDHITGILNGTTNYILTRMAEGISFEDALADAQEKGYAERDPSADIEGHDACRKIAILGSLMTGGFVDAAQVPTAGITHITADDLAGAALFGYAVKLLGSSRRTASGLEISVAPFLIPEDHPLASVRGVFNAIAVHGNMLGTSMYYGQGAGRDATASAVVADVCEIVKNSCKTVPVAMTGARTEIASGMDEKWPFFVRVPRVRRAELFSVFMDAKRQETETAGFIMTAPMTEDLLKEKLSRFGGEAGCIRVMNE